MSTKSKTHRTDIRPYPTLMVANEMIRQQEYLLNRQDEIIRFLVRRNRELVDAGNDLHNEHMELQKELEGFKHGKLWTMISSFLAPSHPPNWAP